MTKINRKAIFNISYLSLVNLVAETPAKLSKSDDSSDIPSTFDCAAWPSRARSSARAASCAFCQGDLYGMTGVWCKGAFQAGMAAWAVGTCVIGLVLFWRAEARYGRG